MNLISKHTVTQHAQGIDWYNTDEGSQKEFELQHDTLRAKVRGQYTVERSILTSPQGTISRAQTRENYDRFSRWYDFFASSEKKFTNIGLQALNVQAGENVLEIGFGTGHALVAITKAAGPSGLATGVELSLGMIAVAKQRMKSESPGNRAALINGDAGWLPFRDKAFDGVFLSFTLELFPADEIPAVLRECKRVLQRGGRIGIVTMARGDSLACRMYEWGHARWPSILDCRPIEVQSWLQESQFRIEFSRVKKMWGLPVEIVLARVN
jgi:ubiquinone/menaquinone biosynthesis C-methylase UbiE